MELTHALNPLMHTAVQAGYAVIVIAAVVIGVVMLCGALNTFTAHR